MDYNVITNLIKETEDLGREAALRRVITKAYEAGRASMGADTTPYGKLLADIRKRIEKMETYISYDRLSDFGFSYNADMDKVVEKLNAEGGFSAAIGIGRMSNSYISIRY